MVQQARYTVVGKLGDIEIREYPPTLTARVEGLGGGSFGLLFNYINGNNRGSSKIDMTAPVITEKIEMTAPVVSDSDSMSFVMPDSYHSIEEVPEPVDERVRITLVPGRWVSVLRFSGRWSEPIFKSKSERLLGELEKHGLKTRGTVFSMLYNAPYTPWFLRRNEVAIEVEPDSVDKQKLKR
jgi:hypothetical protein